MSRSHETKILHYVAQSREDLVHRFAPAKYEILSDSFTSYIDTIKPSLSDCDSLLLEVSGCEFTPAEQESIHRALRFHYRLLYSHIQTRFRNMGIRLSWFWLSLIISSALLFISRSTNQEVLTQFLFLPFWFFGYRLMIYIILDIPSLRKEKKWLRMLATMELRFCGSDAVYCAADLPRKGRDLVEWYYMDGDTLLLECVTDDAASLVNPACAPRDALISAELADYLEQSVPFLHHCAKVKLDISAVALTEAEHTLLLCGIRNHFELRIAEVQQQILQNRMQILKFALGLMLSCIVLGLIGGQINVAQHEVVIMFLWFFGDFLVEYVLLAPIELLREKHNWRKMKEMEVFRK